MLTNVLADRMTKEIHLMQLIYTNRSGGDYILTYSIEGRRYYMYTMIYTESGRLI